MRKYCFSQGFSRCVIWALGKTLGLVVVSFLINPWPTPRILLNSGFAQILFFFPRDFQDAYVGHLEKKTLGFVVVSFLINPRPPPRMLWNTGFAQVPFCPRIFKMCMLGTWKNPRFCSVSFLINPRPTLRILWSPGFEQVLFFFPRDFQDV